MSSDLFSTLFSHGACHADDKFWQPVTPQTRVDIIEQYKSKKERKAMEAEGKNREEFHRLESGHALQLDRQRLPQQPLQWNVPRYRTGPQKPRANWRNVIKKDLYAETRMTCDETLDRPQQPPSQYPSGCGITKGQGQCGDANPVLYIYICYSKVVKSVIS